MKLVQLLENSLEFLLRSDVAMVMPRAGHLGIDFDPEASHDAEVMTGTYHGPEKILMARRVHTYHQAVG